MLQQPFFQKRRGAVSAEGRRNASLVSQCVNSNDRLGAFKQFVISSSAITLSSHQQQVRMALKSILKTSCLATKDAGPIVLEKVLDAFEKYCFPKSFEIVQEDESSDLFFVVESGECQVVFPTNPAKGKHCVGRDIRAWKCHGDVALLHAPEPGEIIVCATDVTVWILKRSSFQNAIIAARKEERRMMEEALVGIPYVRDHLPRDLQVKLIDCFEEKTYSAGKVIFEKGSICDGLCLVLHGGISPSNGLASTPLQFFRAGCYYGESCLLLPQTCKSDIITNEETQCAFLTHDAFERIVGHKKIKKMRKATNLRRKSLLNTSKKLFRSIKTTALKKLGFSRRRGGPSSSSSTAASCLQLECSESIFSPIPAIRSGGLRKSVGSAGRRVRFNDSGEREPESTRKEHAECKDLNEITPINWSNLLDDPVLHVDSPSVQTTTAATIRIDDIDSDDNDDDDSTDSDDDDDNNNISIETDEGELWQEAKASRRIRMHVVPNRFLPSPILSPLSSRKQSYSPMTENIHNNMQSFSPPPLLTTTLKSWSPKALAARMRFTSSTSLGSWLPLSSTNSLNPPTTATTTATATATPAEQAIVFTTTTNNNSCMQLLHPKSKVVAPRTPLSPISNNNINITIR